MRHRLTQSVGQPKDGIHWEEQGTLAGVVDGAGHIVITLADLPIQVGFGISLGVGSSTPWGLSAAPGLLPRLKGDISYATGLAAQAPQPGSDKGLRGFLPRSVRCGGFQGPPNCCRAFGVSMGPNGETNAVVGDGAARLGGPGIPRNIVGCRSLMEDRRGAKEGGGWLGARKGIIRVV